ncbi:MAG TPA: PqiC family protein, partial [Thermodesulfobacteriota bacterium]|nr:PqiC family protein [Thermodesulfobacteriota bacterium]
LPYYLARKEIVTRTDAHRVDVAQNEFWGGSLQDDFSRTLLENLIILLADDGIHLYPWPGGGKGDYRVAVDVLRFDGSRGGEIVLLTKWVVRNGQDNKEMRNRNLRIRETVSDGSYEALVAGMSRAVARLSREIGEDLKSLSR